jgi:RimJ/RimL family protein N-acetyltransferase
MTQDETAEARPVVLRDVADDDLPIFFEQQLDPQANFMAAFTGRNPADRDAFMDHWVRIRADNTNVIRTILFGGQVAGHVASYVDKEFGKREVTYWIGKEYWGRGIASDALSQYLVLVRERPIYGRAARDNVGSIRVMEKCGFVLKGYDRGFANARGEEIDEVILELK